MKQTQLKVLIIVLGTLTLVACNGGGAGGAIPPDPNPTTTPTPTPIPLLNPLSIRQDIIPNLDKVGSHQIWYLIITNQNSESVAINNFTLDTNTGPINPSKYAMKYDNAINNVSIDCLDIMVDRNVIGGIGSNVKLAENKSCAYKLDAQWDINTSSESNFSFKYKYELQTTVNRNYYPEDNLTYVRFNTYIESSNCESYEGENKFFDESVPRYYYGICLNSNNQNLKYNLINLKTKTTYFGQTALSTPMSLGNIFSFDGNGYWYDKLTDNSSIKYSSIDYDSNRNQLSILSTRTFESIDPASGSAGVVSKNGNNYISGYNSQSGIINNINISNRAPWSYGLDGNIYTSGYLRGFGPSAYYLDQSTMSLEVLLDSNNDPVTMRVSGGRILGASRSGNLWVTDDNDMYCYNKSNNYSIQKLNFNGLDWTGFGYDILITPYGYYMDFKDTGKYYSTTSRVLVETPDQVTPVVIPYAAHYLVNLDSCVIESNNYLPGNVIVQTSDVITPAPRSFVQYQLTEKFGIIYESNVWYIESMSRFSNGLNNI